MEVFVHLRCAGLGQGISGRLCKYSFSGGLWVFRRLGGGYRFRLLGAKKEVLGGRGVKKIFVFLLKNRIFL